jgi:type IV pilus assembly protein PilB
MDKKKRLLGAILVEKGIINNEQLECALAEQARTKEFLGAILINEFQVEEKDLLKALSEQFNMPLVALKNKYIDWDFVKQFDPSFVLDSKCFPILKEKDGITIAITNPLDVWRMKKAEEATSGSKLKFALVSEEDMKDAIHRYKEYVKSNIDKLLK